MSRVLYQLSYAAEKAKGELRSPLGTPQISGLSSGEVNSPALR